MKPFRNKGWRWLKYMERILPIAGATGAHSYAPTEAEPPPLIDQDADLLELDTMNVDQLSFSQLPTSTTTASAAASPFTVISSPNISELSVAVPSVQAEISQQLAAIPSSSAEQPPPTKRQRLRQNIGASSSPSVLSLPTNSSQISAKGKGKVKAKTSSDTSPARTSRTLSTSQRVSKITPAVALVELHGSIHSMTQAILTASKAPESAEDKAVVRCQEAVQLVQERDDGLSVLEKASLIVFFGSHHKEVDMYLALKDDQLRQAVIRQWIQPGNLNS